MTITTADHSSILDQILALQAKNLPKNITVAEKDKEGFVSCEHDIDLLTRMNTPYPHVVALDEAHLAGYALVMLSEFRDDLPILRPMFERIDKINWNGCRLSSAAYFVMGQICIDKPFRGQGLFEHMYRYLKKCMSPDFQYCITEISTANKRSLRAHAKIGFETIETCYTPDGNSWEIVLWDWL